MTVLTEERNDYNIVATKGTAVTRTLTWTTYQSTAVNLTGASATFIVAKVYPKTFLTAASQDAAVLSVTDSGGQIGLSGTTGIITLAILDTDMTMDPDIYSYQLLVDFGSNDVRAPISGLFEVRPELT